MKKAISVFLTVLLLAAMFTGCVSQEAPESGLSQDSSVAESVPEETSEEKISGENTPAEKTTIRLGGLKGPTSMGMVKLLDDNENGAALNNYEFTMSGSADELTPKILQGDLDILAVPANLGAILYNNSDGAVQFLAVNTLGIIYMVEKGGETVQTWEDLRGKTVYSIGKGSTPEYALNYLLEQNGIDAETEVDIQWKSEPSEIVAMMASEDHVIALLPQPFVAVAQAQFPDLRVALDLNEAWDSLENGSQLVTTGLIVRTQFAEEHPEAVANFLEEYRASTEYVNANLPEAAALVEKYDIVKADVAEKAIPFCNIVCVTGDEMKTAVQGYFEVLYAQNPAAVGGALPEDDFYYAG